MLSLLQQQQQQLVLPLLQPRLVLVLLQPRLVLVLPLLAQGWAVLLLQLLHNQQLAAITASGSSRWC
jgi:hypothetical protein